MTRVLIAGIAGASLGTEIAKSLKKSAKYELYGCDISPFAYGHYTSFFRETFSPSLEDYCNSVLEFCTQRRIEYIIPGGERPNQLLTEGLGLFRESHIQVVANNLETVRLCASKNCCFEFLRKQGISVPWTQSNKENFPVFPCIVKPSKNSGGSNFVFFARNQSELKLYYEYLKAQEYIPMVQEYIPHHEGEFTVGVLSTSSGKILGSIALKRTFESKLSVSLKSKDCLISSGYSQGLIDCFPEVRAVCEKIAMVVGSTGPLNIQGRLKDGVFMPFEINPRFSASTYLRALAGINEVDMYLAHLIDKKDNFSYAVTPGYYLRSLEEIQIPLDEVKTL